MPNVSIQELMGVLQKSGLPLGGGADMQGVLPTLQKSAIGGVVQGQDTQVAALKQRHRQALDQIAAMDQKLHGVYGDPTSPLFIKNPLAREKITAGAANTGYDIAGKEAKKVQNRQAELEQTTDDAVKLYNELTREQIRLEKEAKKGAKGTGTIKLTKDQKLAGFQDATAANYFSKIKEANFKRDWVQNILSGKAKIPENGYSIKEIQKRYEPWVAAHPPKGKKTTTTITGKKREKLY